jgi:hypothetical protein
MLVPTTQTLLAAWERGKAVPQRSDLALALLSAIYGEAARSPLAQLSIGDRDSLLLELRQQSFGSKWVAVAVCPGCGMRLEMEFSTADLRVQREPRPAGGDTNQVLNLRSGDYDIAFRVPNSSDLAAIQASGSFAADRKQLLHRLVSRASHREEAVSPGQLPEEILDAIEKRMAAADPQAEIRLNLLCCSCGRNWQVLFDVVTFFWSELDAWAIRLLREVDRLARAYGWRESDILAMSPWRRQCYLEMLHA